MKHMPILLSGKPTVYHADMSAPEGALKGALGAPVTEVVTLYFADKSEKGEKDARQFTDMLTKEADGLVALDLGWIQEEVEYEGAKGRAMFAVMGWTSVDAHMAFRGSESFKNNVHLLRDEPKGIEMHHYTNQL